MSAHACLAEIWSALDGPRETPDRLTFTGEGALPSAFAVTDFAAASVGAAALALAEFANLQKVVVDRRLSSLWFAKSIRPIGWNLPPQWDAIAGNYQARDGWVRLHTNAAHHRAACLRVLDCAGEPKTVAACVAQWSAQHLQEAVVAAGGVAAEMLTRESWAAHPQGACVAAEPLVHWRTRPGAPLRIFGTSARPLAGLRVLDLTRVLAGPVATRFLAGFGADVLRIDPPDWDEPAVLAEVTPGKTRARLDLRQVADRDIFLHLLAQADVLVHGLRGDALERLELGDKMRHSLNPHLIDVALNAYGWSGPWAQRRGFDTVVQMSTGLAAEETHLRGTREPQNLAVQALDYGTGHMMAAAVVRALTQARAYGTRISARFSLAKTAWLLARYARHNDSALKPQDADDFSSRVEQTYWGPAQRLHAPFTLPDLDFHWSRPAGLLGDGLPRFSP